jgi:hypothetical protein
MQSSAGCSSSHKKKNAFKKKKLDSGKAFGQPINSKMDEALKRMALTKLHNLGALLKGMAPAFLYKNVLKL